MSTKNISKYEVWEKDRFNRHEIISVLASEGKQKGRPENQWESPEDAIAAAMRYVHNENRTNALTFDEQKKNPKVVLFIPDEGIYAGSLVMGKHKVIVGNTEQLMQKGATGKLYLGNDDDGKPWYLQDARRSPVTTLDNYLVQEKTLVFVHKQK